MNSSNAGRTVGELLGVLLVSVPFIVAGISAFRGRLRFKRGSDPITGPVAIGIGIVCLLVGCLFLMVGIQSISG